MMISSIRTIVTNKAVISVAAVALLGGGAALAAPDSAPPDDVTPEFAPVPLDTVPPEELPAVPELALEEGTDPLDDVEVVVSEMPSYPPVPELPEETEDDDGPGWALGNTAEIDGFTQQDRVEEFCEARIAEAEANGSNGVPPFCTAGEDDDPIPPNARGQRMAEAARGGELGGDEDDGTGPPPWAGRPGGPDRAPVEAPLGDGSDDDVEVERSGPPAGVPAGPPAGVPGRGRG